MHAPVQARSLRGLPLICNAAVRLSVKPSRMDRKQRKQFTVCPRFIGVGAYRVKGRSLDQMTG